MRINILLVMIMVIIFTNCNVGDKGNDCIRLAEVTKNDQKYRMSPLFSKLNYVADSLRRLDSIDINYAEYIIYYYQSAMNLIENDPDLIFPSDYLFDSVNQLQYDIDMDNTKFLIEYISKTSYAKLDTSQCFYDALIAFVHTPNELIPEVEVFIEQYKEIIPENNLRHINWHLKGRVSFD